MNFFSDSKLTTTTSTIYLRTLSFFFTKKALSHGICFEVCQLFLLQSSLPKVVFSLSVDGAKKGFINKFVDGFENSAWQKKWAKKKSMNEKVCKFIHFIGRFNECLNECDMRHILSSLTYTHLSEQSKVSRNLCDFNMRRRCRPPKKKKYVKCTTGELRTKTAMFQSLSLIKPWTGHLIPKYFFLIHFGSISFHLHFMYYNKGKFDYHHHLRHFVE